MAALLQITPQVQLAVHRRKEPTLVSRLDHRMGSGCLRVPSIRGSRWFDKQHVCLFLGNWAVLHAPGHDEKLPWTKDNISFSHLNRKSTLQDEKEIISIVVLVPGEWAFDLDDHEIVAIELADGFGPIVLRKSGQFPRKIDALHRQ
jgi:hypothetical protein